MFDVMAVIGSWILVVRVERGVRGKIAKTPLP